MSERFTERLIDERAIVIGGGIGGLAAAAALSNHFEEVVVLERDAIPDEPRVRRGTPQDEQLHNLLTRAQTNLESLLPGITDDLVDAGAGNARVADQTHVHELGYQMPKRDLGLRLMSAWRPTIEHIARQHLLSRGNIALQGITKAIGLEISHSGNLQGVVCQASGDQEVAQASVVVDATGSVSATHRWMDKYGEQTPEVLTKKVNQWYVSTVFEREEDYFEQPDFWLSFPVPPNTRGGLISPLGDDKWYVSVSGKSTDTPPRTGEEVKMYAETLEDNRTIASLIENSDTLSKPNLFRKTNATLRQYDDIAKPLPGLLPLGDSIASLNPLFGQGMSIAAWQATELNETMQAFRSGQMDLREATNQYLHLAVSSARTAWDLGEVVDKTVVGTSDASLEEMKRKYSSLAGRIADDPELHKLYVGVWHLIEPASKLEPHLKQ